MSDDVVTCFSACSRRVIRAAFLAQIAEADELGIGACDWVSQMSAAVERIELSLENPAYARWARGHGSRRDPPGDHLAA